MWAPRPIAVALLLAATILAPDAARAVGYGRFRWGETSAECLKKEAKLRPRLDVEAVALERRTLKAARDEDEARARAAGPKALARWRESMRGADKKKPPRLSAREYWVEVGGLPARVTLLFLDDKLYGAEVGVLERRGARERGEQLEALLREKYGPPTRARGAETPAAARAGEFDTGDGTLQFFRQPAGNDEGGILQLTYRSAAFGPIADGYVEALQGQLMRIEGAREEARRAKAAAKDGEREAAILQHL